jgi:hypothetical protein
MCDEDDILLFIGSGPQASMAGSGCALAYDAMGAHIGCLSLSLPAHTPDVQGWAPDDGDGAFQTVSCLACARTHLVDVKAGKVVGAPDEDIPDQS